MAGLLIHTASLRSFGVPYTEPIMPLGISGLGDSQFRIPQWLKLKRPSLVSGINKTRQAAGQKPSPPTPEEEDASAKEEKP
jgi:spore germination protein KA